MSVLFFTADPLAAVTAAAGCVGVVIAAKATKGAISFHTRGAKLVNKSSIMRIRSTLMNAKPYVKRPACPELLNPRKAVIVRGPHESGKSVFLANHLLKETFPWYWRPFFPPYGLYLEGRVNTGSVDGWLNEQVSTATNKYGLSVINDAIMARADTQPIRTMLFTHLPWVPAVLHPQPTIIVIDQAEELIGALGAELLVGLYELVKMAKTKPKTLRLIFVVNSDKAVESLLALNGGDLFTVVTVPQPSVSDVEKQLGKHTASVYKDMHGSLGVAMSYARQEDAAAENEPEVERAKARVTYHDKYQETFLRKFGVERAVSLEEIRAVGKKQ